LSGPGATYTGWNLFNERSGPTDVVSSMQGSFIPFPAMKGDRDRAVDPRPSVEERYQSRAQFLDRVAQAAAGLVGQGYVLQADVSRIVEQAATRWDLVVSRAGSQ